MSKLSVSAYHKGGKVLIDDVEVSLHVRRMGMEEFIQYEREYFDYAHGERRKPIAVDVDTSSMSPEEAFFAIQRAEAQAELKRTPAEKEAERDRLIKRAEELVEWVARRVRENCVFPKGEVDIDGQAVETGDDILRVFGARQVLMMQFCNVIWAQNRLPEALLKNLPLPSDSPAGSEGQGREAVGPRPEPTATSAGSGDSAETEAATTTPSGGPSPSGETTGS